ncbi:universal stress protein [Paenibacillus sp. PK4536]|uniref:O-acetylhomoserine aminocarboxypropyltransferase n=1 Tax=Paenibacillus nuruki TaxID=1886670 RepID=A0A1E3L1N8_9BACL|nr:MULTISPECIES: universal stress protein [Paenibacillus]ODP27712.1 O-acetylhomoserine aminocarboxypropyltransferase [Paenibacillus nuruki]TKJ92906.1 universal stress protein [Paenibacillus sp. CFBP13512]WIM38326.1 universal stress protein [Paenibacillus sp. PK4536]CAJ1314996.1 O-acetylhomoserine aminocarboxypropyltransferase [Paenibacillus nuruki]
MSLSHILVPYDGSEHSQKALEKAIGLGTELKAQIEVLYVDSTSTEILQQPLVIPTHELESYFDHEEEDVRLNLRQLISTIPNAQATVIQGSAGKSIVKYADSIEADLIIMGSRGLGTVSEFVMGSVSHYVTQRAKSPVMIVK